MKTYAIINKKTNTVLNIVNAKDESFVFLDPETEYCTFANRAVGIGMTYDVRTNKFTDVEDKGELLDLRDEINSLIAVHKELIFQHSHLTTEELEDHLVYVSNLEEIYYEIIQDDTSISYVQIKEKFDLIGNAPEFPIKELPKEITQDVFRNTLTLTEKILWDNPETGTTQQIAAINTLKIDFPFYGVENMNEELDLLSQVELLTSKRVSEIKAALS